MTTQWSDVLFIFDFFLTTSFLILFTIFLFSLRNQITMLCMNFQPAPKHNETLHGAIVDGKHSFATPAETAVTSESQDIFAEETHYDEADFAITFHYNIYETNNLK